MEVYFASPKLADLLQSPRACTREYGAENAKSIAQRLQNLEYAANLAELASIERSLHELKAERTGQFALRLRAGLRMILIPLDDPPPRKQDGGLNWARIASVIVLSVEDYHA